MKFGLFFIGVSLAWYGICAFISAIPNPMNWGIDGRVMFILMEVFVAPWIAMFIKDTIE
jgi:hypothetical protein